MNAIPVGTTIAGKNHYARPLPVFKSNPAQGTEPSEQIGWGIGVFDGPEGKPLLELIRDSTTGDPIVFHEEEQWPGILNSAGLKIRGDTDV